jgi:opacity protein-like surface antigen
MFRRTLLRSSLVLCVPALVSAQSAAGRFELTPTISYAFGGEIQGEDTFLFDTDLEAEESEALGLTFSIPIAAWAQLELMASHQPTQLEFDEGLFGGDLTIADFDVNYYHVGGLFSWGTGQIEPFVVASAGVTELDPDVPGASSETKFSMSFGGGVKIFFNRNVGVRFEGRGFWTAIDDYNDDYDYACGCDYGYDEGFTQIQASAGLILAW